MDEDGCTAKSDIVRAEPLEMENKRCVVVVHKLVSSSLSKRMGGIQFNSLYYLPSSSLFVRKHKLSEDPSLSSVHVDVHQVLWGIQSLIYWRGKRWNFMKLNIHEHGIL